MPPAISKKAEHLKSEAEKLEHFAKRKVQAIDKSEKTEEENRKKEVHQIHLEMEKFKKKTVDMTNGTTEDTGWGEEAIQIGERMKQLVEHEAREQHNLLLKTDEATKELQMKTANLRKELPLVSDFSEEDRVQMLTNIEKSIKKLKEKREIIEMAESKLNRQLQVLTECTPDPTEDKQTIMSKLQMSYDVVSGANDPERARDDLLKLLGSNMTLMNQPGVKKPPASQNQKPHNSGGLNMSENTKSRDHVSPQRSNPKIDKSQSSFSTPLSPSEPPSALQARSSNTKPTQQTPHPTMPNPSPTHTNRASSPSCSSSKPHPPSPTKPKP